MSCFVVTPGLSRLIPSDNPPESAFYNESMNSGPNDRLSAEGTDSVRILRSWKAIANYLNRTVRTVQRWEKEEQMPVHRHLHKKQGSVFAYAAEIEAWWQSRSFDDAAGRPGRRTVNRRPRLYVVVAAAALAVVAVSQFAIHESSSATGSRGSIAVLPFQAAGDERDGRVFGHALAEEIRSRLSRLSPTLTVIARTSSTSISEGALDPADIAARLGTDLLLTGTVQKDAEVIHVHTRLLDDSGRQLWDRSMDYGPGRLIDLKDDIADAVAASIALTISDERVAPDTPDPDAYQLYLIGREHLGRRDLRRSDNTAAIRAFTQAIEIDPGFARAHGGLALAKALQSGRIMDRVPYEEARTAAMQALGKDQGLAEAHAALGIIELETGHPEIAETSLRHALALDRNLADAGYWLAISLKAQGRFLDAQAELRRALATDPLHPMINEELARLEWESGNFEAARERLVRILQLPEPPSDTYYRLVELHREYGRFEEALGWAKEAATRYPVFSGLDTLILTYQRLEMTEFADLWLRQLGIAEGPVPRLGLRSEYLYLSGRIEECYQLKKAHIERSGRSVREFPFAVQATFGGMAVLSGRYEDGIEIMEPLFSNEFLVPEHLGGSAFALTFAQFLAFAYQETGRPAPASRLLDHIDLALSERRRTGLGKSPYYFVVEARNSILQGDHAHAVRSLRHAVEIGWRDYVFERPNPVWQSIRGNPEYNALMDFVRSDMELQRERIARSGHDTDLERLVAAAIANH